MKSLTKTELAEGLADLASRAIASDDHESPWLQFHEDCVAELESEKANVDINYNNVVNVPNKKIKLDISDVPSESEKKGTFVCPKCMDDPCVWENVGKGVHDDVLAHIEENGGSECLTNQNIRFFYYRKVTEKLFGYLGAHNCRRLPDCVVDGVRELFPNPPGIPYTGYSNK